MNNKELIGKAMEVRERSYSPYSGFSVGAALLAKSGRVFTGCNVENISYRLTTCAEQAAVAAAVSQGEREFIKIAVVADSRKPVVPCGACRQVLAEFNPALEVIMSTVGGGHEMMQLDQLLPLARRGILESLKDV